MNARLWIPTVAALCIGCGDGPTTLPPGTKCSEQVASLPVGGVLQVASSGPEESVCVDDAEAGRYIAVLFNAAAPRTRTGSDMVLQASGHVPQAAAPVAHYSVRPGIPDPLFDGPDGSFATWLRARERAHLTPRISALHDRKRERSVRAPRTSVEEGDFVWYDVNSAGDCDVENPVNGRVVAVSETAIVVADVDNPDGGFSDPEYRAFAERFDDFILPTVEEAFGEATDLDDNGRVILFFTRGVNEILPPGGQGFVSGFFWSGDLFPFGECPSSNYGEILYLAVPDPAGEAGTEFQKEDVQAFATFTIGHEYQHLINSARRLHVNQAVEFEETWLNEAMSFIAEELMFYRASGESPRRDLGVDDVLDGGTRESAFREFGLGNIGRFNIYVQDPRFSSPTGRDALGTRGAGWSFLRYTLDRRPGPDAEVTRALANGTVGGVDNLTAALEASSLQWMPDWAVSVAADGTPGIGAAFDQPSWDLAGLIEALRDDARYPLEIFGLENDGLRFRLGPSNGGYVNLRGRDGEPLRVAIVPEDESTTAIFRLALVRIE